MHTNAAVGRSMNDISQYPVFPWILADYTSDSINLKDPSVYRDLSKVNKHMIIGMYTETVMERSTTLFSVYVILTATKDSLLITQPVGALNQSKLEQYAERYECWESDQIPAFHYGTHYSTLAFVFHWLVRVVSIYG